ncbi:prepilin-type N-terminal cleavage/methylation domain-containing protein [Cytophagaceae bacterium ABcell3]|nr:prepilin-type N-terminal cleavage/methylation domain-containing protein [Cytophagaceae bacterium ABcell3]
MKKKRFYWSNNVRAFTILELTVAMVLSGIIIISAYNSYFFLFKGTQSLISKSKEKHDFIRFHSLFSYDFFTCKKAVLDQNQVQMDNSSSGVKYVWLEECIVRLYNNVPDTFKLVNKGVSGYFEGDEILVPGHVCDAIEFDYYAKDSLYKVSFEKVYLPDFYLNSQPVQY